MHGRCKFSGVAGSVSKFGHASSDDVADDDVDSASGSMRDAKMSTVTGGAR